MEIFLLLNNADLFLDSLLYTVVSFKSFFGQKLGLLELNIIFLDVWLFFVFIGLLPFSFWYFIDFLLFLLIALIFNKSSIFSSLYKLFNISLLFFFTLFWILLNINLSSNLWSNWKECFNLFFIFKIFWKLVFLKLLYTTISFILESAV